jgi:hypothetical protein
VKYDASVKRVKALFDFFKKRGSKLVTSNRTSTHVHFNMGDKNAYQLVNLFILFTILEGILDNYCGEDRAGNLFCLSSRHAQRQIDWIEDSCFKDFHFGNLRENFRYCSMNIASINKFGTVEFRAMRGLDNEQDVLDWLTILDDLCQYGCYKMKNPVTMLEEISVKGPLMFLKSVFKFGNFMKLTQGVDEGAIADSMYQGLRLVQMLAYRVGTEFDQVRLRGPDFWASLQGDAPPVPDVDPKDLVQAVPLGGGRPQRLGNRPQAGQRANPFPPENLPVGRGDRAEDVYVAERVRLINVQEGRMVGAGEIEDFRRQYRAAHGREHVPPQPVEDRIDQMRAALQRVAAENGAQRPAQPFDPFIRWVIPDQLVRVMPEPPAAPIVPALEDEEEEEELELEPEFDPEDEEDEE